MKTYDDLVMKIERVKEDENIKSIINKQLDDLDNDSLAVIHQEDPWILQEEDIFTGQLAGQIRDRLYDLLEKDLAS